MKTFVSILVLTVLLGGCTSKSVFPSVNLLPEEFQKEAVEIEKIYRDLLIARTESERAFEDLKDVVAVGNRIGSSKITEAIAAYKAVEDQHWVQWSNFGDRFKNSVSILDRLIPMDEPPLREEEEKRLTGQWLQYLEWLEVVHKGWDESIPPTQERLLFLKRALGIPPEAI